MAREGPDGILELLKQASSEEEFLLSLDDPRRKHELISALEGEGRMYELENDIEFTELDTGTIGVGMKLYEYLHRDPPEKRPQEVQH